MICLQTATVFWLVGGNISHSSRMHMGFMMLGRQKYTEREREREEPLLPNPSGSGF
jgi:hypothetical protein